MSRKTIDGYSDGACKGNPGLGGWGWAFHYTTSAGTDVWWKGYGSKKHTTNQEMELSGMDALLSAIPYNSDTTLYLDSTYVLNGLIQGGKHGSLEIVQGVVQYTGWIAGWIKNRWKNSSGQDVKHQTLWKSIMDRCKAHLESGSTITLEWVQGHADCYGNNLADAMANRGVENNS